MTQPEVLVARAHEKFDQAGALIDQATRGFLARFLEGFSEWIAHSPYAEFPDARDGERQGEE